jgi:putative flippase GtrA
VSVDTNRDMRTLRKAGERPVRYLLAGGLNTLVGLSAYPILLWVSPWFHEHYLVALAIVQVFCLIFAFSTYKFGVFRTRTNIVNEFWKFSSYYLINYAANWLALPLLVEVGKIPPIYAQFGFALCVIVGSYFWHSNITFKPVPDEGDPNETPVQADGPGDQPTRGQS